MIKTFIRPSAARLLAASALITLAAAPAAAQTLRLADSSATTIRGGDYEDENFASSPILEVRASSSDTYERRVVLKFDTHNTLPKGTRIGSARLTLTVAGGNDETRQLAAYGGSLSYDEATATWNERKDDQEWSRPGGESRRLAAKQTVTDRVGSRVTFDVTTTVQKVVNGSYGNARYARFLLADTGRSSRGSYKQFFSDEAGDVSVRPTLVITLGASGGAVAQPPAPKPAPARPAPRDEDGDRDNDDGRSSSTLKVLDWNIHHGVNTRGAYSVERQAAYIARINPDVVSLNEVERYTGWGNEDQPARFAALLKAKTGRTWYYQFAQRDGGSKGQGNLLLSVYRFEDTADHVLSYSRSVAQAVIMVKGRRISLFSTHLDDGSGGRRSAQMGQLTRWAESFPESRVLMGDFNAWPGSGEINKMKSGHRDVWAEAKRANTAVANSGNSAGNTRRSRIDYIWLSENATHLRIRGARVYDGRDTDGVMLSDHRPLLATFEMR
ncbi:MAG: DNRLRE domain-containing protein [Acidobacteriota bacterium]|nr:DNRLRE domain-containing protein [Acidobacteriota bacterium]